jgi:hypothetical protein
MIWEGSKSGKYLGKTMGTSWEKYGNGWRNVRALVKQANTWSKCLAMGLHVIF